LLKVKYIKILYLLLFINAEVMLIVSVGNTRADRKWSVDVGSMYAAFPLGADPGDDRPPPKTFESNFIQHDFVQYRKQHS